LNHWDSIKLLARKYHEAAREAAKGDLSASALLSAAEGLTGIPRCGVPSGDPLLYKTAHAVLHSGTVWFNQELEPWQALFYQAHEYAHHWFHGQGAFCSEADINAEATEDPIQVGAKRVEGYGPHERHELEANVFAREFLLPGHILRELFLEGLDAEEIAVRSGMPIGMVYHQLSRALLSPPLKVEEGHSIQEQSAIPDLNDSQRRAAESTDRPSLVDAGPGTGKTRTLVGRISRLLTRSEERIRPSQILALTYSNKAAEEMFSRVRAVAPNEASQVWMGTFHAFGLELLRKHYDRIGLSPRPSVIDPLEAQLMLEQALAKLPLHHYRSFRDPTWSLRHILSAISRAKDEKVGPAKYAELAQQEFEVAQTEYEQLKARKALEVARVYDLYQDLLSRANCLDYGDLIYRAVLLLEENEDIRNALQERYTHILIDEYQDVNTVSRLLLKQLAGDGKGLWVVGDVRQAIYRFRGAAPVNMKLLKQDFPDLKIVPLETNYRSDRSIIDMFSACAARMRATRGIEQEEWEAGYKSENGVVKYRVSQNEKVEAEELVEEVRNLRQAGVRYRDQAVLCREHSQLAFYSDALERQCIPVLYFGDFFERPEIRDLLSLISLTCERDGSALFRLAQFEEYAIPFQDVLALISSAREQQVYFPDALRLAAGMEGITEAGKRGISRLLDHIEGITFGNTAWNALARYLFVKSGYVRNLLAGLSNSNQQKLLAVYQLLLFSYQLREQFQVEQGNPKRQFLNYVRRLKLTRQDKPLRQLPEWADDIDAVRMLTVHASKGLEFRAVHLPGLGEGKFPLREQREACPPPTGLLAEGLVDWQAEEEECLFFVALSRARDYLCMYRARQYNGSPCDPSPLLEFLRDVIPRAVVNPPVKGDSSGRRFYRNTELQDGTSVFKERELATFMECPLKYYYHYVLRISRRRGESAYAQTNIFIHQVWNWIDRERGAGRVVDRGSLARKFNDLWQKLGPVGHPYEEEYRWQAEGMITRTLFSPSISKTELLRPEWRLSLPSGKVIVRPHYVDLLEDNGGLVVRIYHLTIGPASQAMKDNVYALYLKAAEQIYPQCKRRVSVINLSTGETREVRLSSDECKASLRRYEAAIQGVLSQEFNPRPEGRRCSYCACFFICPTVDRPGLPASKLDYAFFGGPAGSTQ
jgi:DNA helicase II / ATP-dependent DNA helicase PcrA